MTGDLPLTYERILANSSQLTVQKVFLIAFEQSRMLVIEKKQHEIGMQYKETLRQFAGDLDKASNGLSK